MLFGRSRAIQLGPRGFLQVMPLGLLQPRHDESNDPFQIDGQRQQAQIAPYRDEHKDVIIPREPVHRKPCCR